jgi:hypothetical protein
MAMLSVQRLDSLPATPSSSTLYILKNTTDAALAEFYVTGTDAGDIRHLMTGSDIVSNANPLSDGVANQGTSSRLARQDHVHPALRLPCLLADGTTVYIALA